MKKSLFLLLILLSYVSLQSQPAHRWVEIIVAPDRPNWTYATGDPVTFSVTVLKSNVPMENVAISYEIGPEKMEPIIKSEAVLKNGTVHLKAGTMQEAGFLRCTITVEYEGREYTEWATAGFSPETIQPTVKLPADFQTWWASAMAENDKLPMDVKMTLLPDRCTEQVNVYHVSLQNWKAGARLYGILCVPKKEGKYPAVLKVPGAGIRPYRGDVDFAEQGIISLEIGIHGISVIMEQQNYNDLLAGWNNHYWNNGIHDKDTYFYKRVFLGCIRANDFLTSLPQWDGRNLGVMGSSQGGSLTLVTAGLDKRVTAAAPVHPAMCDMTGYLKNRAGGWPHYLADKTRWNRPSHTDVLETITYYDAVNFARLITVPTLFSFGYNDNVCPPTSVYAAYNVINAPKETFLALKTAHWVFPEQMAQQREWMISQLKK